MVFMSALCCFGDLHASVLSDVGCVSRFLREHVRVHFLLPTHSPIILFCSCPPFFYFRFVVCVTHTITKSLTSPSFNLYDRFAMFERARSHNWALTFHLYHSTSDIDLFLSDVAYVPMSTGVLVR